MFVLVALPIFRGYSQGGTTGHVVLLGLAPDFDRTLRLEPSIYELLGLYNDSFAFSTINSYGNRIEHRKEGGDLSSADYDRAAIGYLRQIASVFPGDIVTRSVAAMRVLPRYFLDSSLYPPVQIQSNVTDTIYRFRNRVWWRLAPLALPALVMATFAVATIDPRAAWLIVLVMIGFGATSATQFNERHFYYLEFIPWFAFGLLGETALAFASRRAEMTRDRIRNAALILVIVGAGTGAAIVSTRAYQQRAAARLFESYERAPHTRLPIEPQPRGSNRTLFSLREWQAPLSVDAGRVFTRFLRVRFRDDQCRASSVPVTLRYESVWPDADLTQRIDVPVRAGASAPTKLYAAVYDRGDESIRFRGIEVAPVQAACVDGVDRVDGLDDAPLLLTTIMAADWRQERLYQRFR
jgi:hypothetical protein